MGKEHNGDYLTDSFDVELRFESGLESPPWGPQGSGQVAKYLEQQLTA
jgi:hypothetical protein